MSSKIGDTASENGSAASLTLVIRLAEVMASCGRRRGKRLTLEELAGRTGISLRTLGAMKNTPGYNPSLEKLALICRELDVTAGELLEVGEVRIRKRTRGKRQA